MMRYCARFPSKNKGLSRRLPTFCAIFLNPLPKGYLNKVIMLSKTGNDHAKCRAHRLLR